MNKSLVAIYKIPFLISVTLALVLLGVGSVSEPLSIAYVLVGAFAGMFVLDLEYFLNAYFLDPQSDFSKTLIGFVKHSDWGNALRHVYYHKEDSKENSLNSALFQMVLAFMAVYVTASTSLLFAKALILTVFAQSIYVLFEYYFRGRTDDWFWALAKKPTKAGVQLYIFALFLVLSFCIYVF